MDKSKLRYLDFDDLYLLKYLLDGNTLVLIAGKLGLTQPAITQRVRKIEQVFEVEILRKAGRSVALTPFGRVICENALISLKQMQIALQAVTPEIEGATAVDQSAHDSATGIHDSSQSASGEKIGSL